MYERTNRADSDARLHLKAVLEGEAESVKARTESGREGNYSLMEIARTKMKKIEKEGKSDSRSIFVSR